jgi:hypothetical protein
MPIEWHFINHKQGLVTMKNYFENQKVHWHQFSPQDIMFKSNTTTKKLLPEENVLSWKTKDSRHEAMAKKTGATPHANKNWNNQTYTWYSRDSYKAVFVQLTKVKQEFVGANLDFINYKPKKNSMGGVVAGLDALVYINSFHDNFEWKKDANGKWTNVKTSTQSLPDYEGYRIAYGGQGDSNYVTHQEWIEIGDISQAVVNFLVERVLPLKNGTLVEEFQLGEKVMVA